MTIEGIEVLYVNLITAIECGFEHIANKFANENGLEPFRISQIYYSLAHTSKEAIGDPTIACMDTKSYGWYKKNNFPVMAFSPQAKGFFSKQISKEDLQKLLELIERDALMINFMQRLNPPEIDIDTIEGENKKLIEKIKKEYNIKIYIILKFFAMHFFIRQGI